MSDRTEDVFTMNDLSTLVGKPLDWRLRGFFKPDWRLYYDGRLVASLVQKKILSYDREATYDCIPVDITYDKRLDILVLRNSIDGSTIGTVENILKDVWVDDMIERMWTLRQGNGKTYTLLSQNMPSPEGSFFRDQEGKALARTIFSSSAPQTSQFTLLSSEDLAISPWLMAMISHYHAMAIVAGSGSM